jgi:hypothetical protein
MSVHARLAHFRCNRNERYGERRWRFSAAADGCALAVGLPAPPIAALTVASPPPHRHHTIASREPRPS